MMRRRRAVEMMRRHQAVEDFSAGKRDLRAVLLWEIGDSADPEIGDRRLSGALISMGASIMVRRHFSGTRDVRSITAYVTELFGGNASASMSVRRLAEIVIRSELGELEFSSDLEDERATVDVAMTILSDLVRRQGFGPGRIDDLLNAAESNAIAIQGFLRERALSPRGFLRRALDRRTDTRPTAGD